MKKFLLAVIAALAITTAAVATATASDECHSSCVRPHVVCVQACDLRGQDQADCKQSCSEAFASCSNGCPTPVDCATACPVDCGTSCPALPPDCSTCVPDCSRCQAEPDCSLCPVTGTCPTSVTCSNISDVLTRIDLEEFRLTLAIASQHCLTRADLYHFRVVGPCHIVKKKNGASALKCKRNHFFILIDP